MDKKRFFVFVIILILAIFSRFSFIDLRPLHADEGVVGWFFANGIIHGIPFEYSPLNYHGPVYQYFAAFFFLIFGTAIWGLRLPSAVIGVVLVVLPMLIKFKDENFDKYGKYFLSLFILISPSMLYFSRDAIQETTFLFLSFLSIYFFIKFIEEKRRIYLPFFAISLAFAFATKETAIFLVFVFLIISIFYYRKFVFLFEKKNLMISLFSFFLFLLVYFLLFSNLMTYVEGFFLSFSGFLGWGGQAVNSGHAKPFVYYSLILLQYELPLVLLSFLGIFYAFRTKNSFYRIIVVWAVVMFLSYSFTPYKTPWLIINITFPLCFLSAIGLSNMYKRNKNYRLTALIAIIAVFYLGFFSVQTSFLYSWQQSNKFAYVQTDIDALRLLGYLKDNPNKSILLFSNNYWPLPFYLQNFYIDYISSTNYDHLERYLSRYDYLILDQEGFNNLNLENVDYKSYLLRPGVNIYLVFKKGG